MRASQNLSAGTVGTDEVNSSRVPCPTSAIIKISGSAIETASEGIGEVHKRRWSVLSSWNY